jgi:general secretion pathway protein G
MIERLQARRNSENGFTLVELLVVIVILGVLASIVVFAVGGITDKGSKSATATDVSVLQAAEEAHLAQSGGTVYVSETQLVTLGFIKAVSKNADICLSPLVASPAAAAGAKYEAVPSVPTAGAVNSCTTAGLTGYTLAP